MNEIGLCHDKEGEFINCPDIGRSEQRDCSRPFHASECISLSLTRLGEVVIRDICIASFFRLQKCVRAISPRERIRRHPPLLRGSRCFNDIFIILCLLLQLVTFPLVSFISAYFSQIAIVFILVDTSPQYESKTFQQDYHLLQGFNFQFRSIQFKLHIYYCNCELQIRILIKLPIFFP